MKKNIIPIITTFLALGFFIAIVVLSLPQAAYEEGAQNNAIVLDGKQVIEIKAKGGYSPKLTMAKANMLTVLKVKTMATFDCSSSLTIPSIDYQKYLPASGETLIEIPPQEPGSTLQGLCAMGMYNFAVNFR